MDYIELDGIKTKCIASERFDIDRKFEESNALFFFLWQLKK